jgi:cysteine desulfuration protein SufE
MTDAIEQLAEDFALLPDWEERYAHVIALGKSLAPLAEMERSEANRVRGCASQVWLVRDPDTPGGVLHFRADSDAHIVRGLLAIILHIYSGQTARSILTVDPATLLDRLHLRDALTPQRSNGVASVLARIQAEAAQAASSGAPSAR